MIGFIARTALGFLVAGYALHPAETQAIIVELTGFGQAASVAVEEHSTMLALADVGEAALALFTADPPARER